MNLVDICVLYLENYDATCKREKWKIVDLENDLWKSVFLSFALSLFLSNICWTIVSFDVNAFHEYACMLYTHSLIIVYTILLIDNIELAYRKNIVLYPRQMRSY